MALTISAKPKNMFEDPIGLMTDCHRRIERFLYVLVTIQRQTHGGMLNEDQRNALTCALRYFRESAPRHMKDEEDSLFPKMHAPDIHASLQLLCVEHRDLEMDHSILEMLGERWLYDDLLCEGDSLLFGTTLSRVNRIYRKHIKMEETVVFPEARKRLNKGDILTIGKEMAARRS